MLITCRMRVSESKSSKAKAPQKNLQSPPPRHRRAHKIPPRQRQHTIVSCHVPLFGSSTRIILVCSTSILASIYCFVQMQFSRLSRSISALSAVWRERADSGLELGIEVPLSYLASTHPILSKIKVETWYNLFTQKKLEPKSRSWPHQSQPCFCRLESLYELRKDMDFGY
jgi:hypothetical protein